MLAIAVFILLMAGALLCSAFFSASETAAFQVGPADVRALPEGGRMREALGFVLSHRRRILVTVLLLNDVFNVLYMSFGLALSAAVAGRLGPQAHVVSDALIVLTLVVFGDVLPKTLALRDPAPVARLAALPLVYAEKLIRVPRLVLTAIADSLMRLFGAAKSEGDVTPAELQELLRLAASRGTLGMDEHEWLAALVELDRVPVKEVIVPRVEMTTFDLSAGRGAFVDLFVETRRNKIPVHDGSVDKIRGYLSGKDVLSRPDQPLEDLIRPVTFIPESASIASAMQQMQAGARRLAIVVDEYGGTEGLVTQEDLVESVVGDLADESEDRWEPVRETAPGTFLVDAALPMHELRRIFGPGAVRRGIATVGGLVSATLERVPKQGDTVGFGKVLIEVVAMRGRRPDRLLIRHRQVTEATA